MFLKCKIGIYFLRLNHLNIERGSKIKSNFFNIERRKCVRMEEGKKASRARKKNLRHLDDTLPRFQYDETKWIGNIENTPRFDLNS